MPPVPPVYELKTRRCTIHVGRFRWDILENGKPIESSAESFLTRREARQKGLTVNVSRLEQLKVVRQRTDRLLKQQEDQKHKMNAEARVKSAA
jgi:hypothetical protein